MKRTIATRMLPCMLVLMLLAACLGCAAKSGSSASYPMEAPMEAAYTEDAVAFDSAAEMASAPAAGMMNAAAKPAAQQSAAPADAQTRKIVYNADMSVTADDPIKMLEALISRCEALGGYISDSYNTTDDNGVSRSSATLKIPADQLDALVNEAKSLAGQVTDYQLSSDDISLSYYDVAARLESAKAEEKQLLELLTQCTTVEEIVTVRESLASVRSDVESYQAQINLWDNLVSYATLTISIRRTPQPAVAEEKKLIEIWKASDVWNRMTRGFNNSARFVVNAISAIGIFLAVAIIPAAILFACIGVPIIVSRKRKKAKAAAARAAKAGSSDAKAVAPEGETGDDLDDDAEDDTSAAADKSVKKRRFGKRS